MEGYNLENTKRINFFDIAKGIGILCVILGHMEIEAANRIVYTFHMPLFFFISGYFGFKREEKMSEFVKQKFDQLIVPYIFTSFCVVIINAIREFALGGNTIKRIFTVSFAAIYGSGNAWEKPFHIEPIGAIWFLPALFIALVVVKYFNQYKKPYLFIILLAYIGYKTSQFIWLPFDIQAGLVAAIFVYLGNYSREIQLFEIKINKVIVGGLISIWTFCILFGGSLYMVRNYYGNGLLDVIGALAAVYLIIIICRYIDTKKNVLGKILGFLGRNSLVILCAHLIEINFMIGFIYRYITNLLLPQSVIYFLLFVYKTIFCIFILIVFQYISITNKIFKIKK